MASSPLRILYLHQYFVLPDGTGGTRSYEFARRFMAEGHHVTMITSSAHLNGHFERTGRVTQCVIQGIPMVIIDVPYDNTMSFPRRIIAFLQFAFFASLQAMRQRGDVIFATSTPLTIAIPAILGKLWQRIPMIFEVRDLWPELPIAIGALRNPIFKRLASWLEWWAYHSAKHIVALSPGMAEGVQKRGIPAERVSVIPNSCDVEMFDVPAERGDSIRAELGLTPTQPLIVYTGTFGKINHVGYVVDVAKVMQTLLPECHFLLVGAGAEFEAVKAHAEASGVLGKNLTVWTPRPKTQIPAILSAATVTLATFLPLKEMWNNSANKFFDALAAGRPIAINYGGWQAELLQETGAGLQLDADDTQLAAQQLADFIHQPQRLETARKAAHDLAYTRFNRDKMAEQLLQIIVDTVQS